MAFGPAAAGASGYRKVSPKQPSIAVQTFGHSWYFRRVGSTQPRNRTMTEGPVIPPNPLGTNPYEDWESYTVGVDVNGLNGYWNWAGPWVVFNMLVDFDDFESYTVGANVAGLNGGYGWTSAYFVY